MTSRGDSSEWRDEPESSTLSPDGGEEGREPAVDVDALANAADELGSGGVDGSG
jgi:hypothetical protein